MTQEISQQIKKLTIISLIILLKPDRMWMKNNLHKKMSKVSCRYSYKKIVIRLNLCRRKNHQLNTHSIINQNLPLVLLDLIPIYYQEHPRISSKNFPLRCKDKNLIQRLSLPFFNQPYNLIIKFQHRILLVIIPLKLDQDLIRATANKKDRLKPNINKRSLGIHLLR